jgi:hypothetical protein
MYDLPALVEHVCKETGYDKVRSASARWLCIDNWADWVHRTFARQWASLHLSLAWNVSILGQEIIGLHRSRTGCLRRPLDNWLPLHHTEQGRVEYLEEVLWSVRFHPTYALGV